MKRAPLPPLIPTESQDIDDGEDIYDDTVAVTGPGDNDQDDIYDDTLGATEM